MIVTKEKILLDVVGIETKIPTNALAGKLELSVVRELLGVSGFTLLTSARIAPEQHQQGDYLKMVLLDKELKFVGYLLCREIIRPEDDI